jgi:flagellar hook-basal body complex protein FliE
MIIPAVGGLVGDLSGVSSTALPSGASSAALPGSTHTAPVEQPEGLSNEGLSSGGIEGVSGGESGGFSGELSNAISSLEQTQTSADGAAQALATGKAQDPEGAVATVADAQMAMDLAAQIRTKATEAAQSIFQTQV